MMYREVKRTFWDAGQKVYYRSHISSKQTYNFDVDSDNWKGEQVARVDHLVMTILIE
jgi:hypothetical protein